jgi:O-acetyl-ADP-ribose deacetylase (regulator of RNase III)
MLIYHRTSIMESNAQTVVNTVNCVGVMGKGIAAEFKSRFPSMFVAYKRLCDEGAIEPGKLWLWRGPDQWVLNFPTKKHWRNPSRLEWIEAGLQKFAAQYQKRSITDISFPRLGCGNGNLDWADVKPLMEKYLSPLPINIYVHDFERDIGIPEHLEKSARSLSHHLSFDGSFAKFLSDIEFITAQVGEEMIDLDNGEPFKARLCGDQLQLEDGDRVSTLGEDDLRGVWLSLVSGLLTQEKLAWSAGRDATQVISLVSLLPCTRAIQIQRPRAPKPELAVEMRRKPGATGVSERDEQRSFSWA